MSKELIHSVVLIIAVVLSFVFPQTSLAQYDLQISAILFVILFVGKRILSAVSRGKSSRLLESVVFTLVVCMLINSTGGTQSPFFFLLYFLLFSVSLLLEPVISITMTLALIIMFIVSLSQGQDFKALLPILSLAFITPFALLLGQEHTDIEKLKVKNEKLQEDTFLFLSLILKNHIKTIKTALENYMGDNELREIKKQTQSMEKVIDRFEEE